VEKLMVVVAAAGRVCLRLQEGWLPLDRRRVEEEAQRAVPCVLMRLEHRCRGRHASCSQCRLRLGLQGNPAVAMPRLPQMAVVGGRRWRNMVVLGGLGVEIILAWFSGLKLEWVCNAAVPAGDRLPNVFVPGCRQLVCGLQRRCAVQLDSQDVISLATFYTADDAARHCAYTAVAIWKPIL
jgi:hypothetical protein